jgi:pimeloyl-ACP methyl ester carboxylesterase
MTSLITLIVVSAVAILLFAYLSRPYLPVETDAIIDQVLNRELPELVTGETGFASCGELQIWYERLRPEAPAKGTVLLIMGSGGDALMWPPRFVRALVAAGYEVVRYDHRDTGLSSRVEEWDRKAPYTAAELAGDALAVLDALDLEKAHLVGLSLGGMVAQELAIQQPQRVASLALLMTSGYVGDPELPGPGSRYLLGALLKGLPLLKYRIAGGERNLIKERVAKEMVASGAEKIDIEELAVRVLYDLRKRKGVNVKAALRHQAALTHSGSRHERLGGVTVPSLVVHGTADPLIPVEHGQKLAAILPNATGLWLDGVGHVFPPPDIDGLVDHLVAHLDRAGGERSLRDNGRG